MRGRAGFRSLWLLLVVLSVFIGFGLATEPARAQVPCSQTAPICDGDCPLGTACARDLAGGGCLCEPDDSFPPAGTDLSPSTGVFRVDVSGTGTVDADVAGEILLQWQDPVTDPVSGERTVQTEMLSMDLSGAHPSLGSLTVRAGSQFGLPATLGTVTPINPGSDFPALATFDVFFEVEVSGVATLRNDEPLVMEAVIDQIPPRSVGLRNGTPVLLTDIANPTRVDVLQTALHWMCPPPFPPPGIPCPVPCNQNPFPVCSSGDCPAGEQCVPDDTTGLCACRPGFPPTGTDLSPTTGIFRVDVLGLGEVDSSVSGEALLQWQDPQTDPVTGERTVQTEMLAMDLSGSHPVLGSVNLRAGTQFGLAPTLGSVTPLGDGDFPARASFDVFFEVDVVGVGTLENAQPLVMEADITEIPPRSITLRNREPVDITDPVNPGNQGTISTSGHWMCPPPFPPPGVPCPVPCSASPFPACGPGQCPVGQTCVPNDATGECLCVPPFPPAGTDLSPSVGIFRVDMAGIGPVDSSVSGEILLEWQDPVTDPVSGQRTVQTEMLSMDLSGSHPSLGNLNLRAGSLFGLQATLGSVTPINPGSDFPALATFDVFFEVDVVGVATLENSQPLVMEAVITEIPPRNITLQNRDPVVIEDPAVPGQTGTLQTSGHWMCPPPFPPPGVPCPVPCDQSPYPVCLGDCPTGQQCVAIDLAGGTGVCRCLDVFPPAGFDLSPSTGIFRVSVPNVGTVDTDVSGELLLEWQDPQTDPVSGQRTVQTEMLSMDLSGSHPSMGLLTVRAGSQFGLPPTLGSVTPLGDTDFPALATFDVFFEVDVAGVTTLTNPEPLVMEAVIHEIPPRDIGLQNAAAVLLDDLLNPGQPSVLQQSFHWMCPPPFPPPGVPCPVPCSRTPFPVCGPGECPPGLRCEPDTATGACSCVQGYPPAGTDLSPSVGVFQVNMTGIGVVDADVSGDILLEWQDPQDDPATGQRSVQTEMLSMDLSGSHPALGPITVRAGTQFGLPATLGAVTPVTPGSDFPATATFDVFFEVEIPGGARLRNDQPLVMEAEIDEIPPRSVTLRNREPVEIEDPAAPGQGGTLQTSGHWMCPPPFPPPGVPCPVPCSASPFPVCGSGTCPPAETCVPNDETGECICVPSFPPAGTDLSPSVGIFRVDMVGIGPVDSSVSGELLLEWQAPQTDPVSGQRTVQTEMLSMDLSGSHPVLGNLNLRAGALFGLPATQGSVTPINPGSDFPALATFDVFFEVDVPGVATLENSQPLVMEAVITEIPPRSVTLRNLAPVVIEDPSVPGQTGTLQTSGHWMCPPPFPPPGVPCPVPCSASPFPVCGSGLCPTGEQCVPDPSGVCRCLGPFPPAGFDLSPSVGVFRVDVPALGELDASLHGEILLEWQDPETDPVSGQRTVQTEMLSMDLSGSHPSLGNLNVRAGGQQGLSATLGSVTPIDPGSDFPALATFDVFFEVDVPGIGTLENDQPLVMEAVITEIPPRSVTLQNAAPVVIDDPANPGANPGTIQTSGHWMCPPPFPPAGVPCPLPCSASPFPVCLGDCPTGLACLPDSAAGVCVCLAPPPPGAGEIPDRQPGQPLTVLRLTGGQLQLDWGASCIPDDSDYEVYEGQLVPPFDSHLPRLCSTGGAQTAVIGPPAGSAYYLIVPRNNANEGSYGKDGAGAPRPTSAAACLPQVLGTCP